MKLLDINGKEVSIALKQSNNPIKETSKSKLQGLVGEYISTKYPHEPVLEEFVLPSSRLSVDYFLPRMGLVIEIQGIQHTEYSAFFHGERSKMGFVKQKKHDMAKENWSNINGFRFIEIFNEKDLVLI